VLEFRETYRGQDIYIDWARIYRYENAYRTSLLDPAWYSSLTAIKAAIDAELAPVTPPPAPAYTCPTCGASFSTEALLQAHVASAHPPPPPPTPTDRLVETYQGVEVWWIEAIGMYRATVAVGYTAVGYTLEEVRAAVDGILEFLNPPPSGGDSLLSQVVDTIKAWLEPVIRPWTAAWDKFQTDTWPSWTSSFSSLKASWDYFNSYTVPSMLENLRGLRDTWDTFWTKDYPAMLAARQAKEAELAARIEAERMEREVTVSEGDAATLERMRTDFPGWFVENMMTTMLAPFTFMFNFLSSKAMQGVAESFWRGLDEGLRE